MSVRSCLSLVADNRGRGVAAGSRRSPSFLHVCVRAHARRVVLAALALATAVAGLGAGLPAVASAFLPDNRVYEQASPPNKNGNNVSDGDGVERGGFGLATADGNAVAFTTSGAVSGAAVTGLMAPYVARRSPAGWATSPATPRAVGVGTTSLGVFTVPLSLIPASDFSSFVFTSPSRYVSSGQEESPNIFFTSDPAVEPTWLSRPTIPNPIPALGGDGNLGSYFVAGATPDLSTVYFTYSGTLLPQDTPRAPHIGTGEGRLTEENAWGFYEWSHGLLSEAGVRPDGTLSPFGAAPAAIAGSGDVQPAGLDNEVSVDGSRAFFVSPDPRSSHPVGEPTELYVRETAPGGSKSTVLVSQSRLPGHVGEPAPHGPATVTNAFFAREGGVGRSETYAYGSPDGSHAFFASTDQLTSQAPNDSSVKEYELDLATSELTYLPGVVGPIGVSTPDGSRFTFENTSTEMLEMWSGGPGGGRVTPVAQLSANTNGYQLNVGPSLVTPSGSVFVFETNAAIPGFNNGGFEQVYRYDVANRELTCVSCPPAGVTPSGNANLSHDNHGGFIQGLASGFALYPRTTVESRGLSSDGSQVFFDTPDPLVAKDTNGKYDVYEWDNGARYLISSGVSPRGSVFLDSSASGSDVFFTTAQGLVPGDVDGAVDVYDARVPRPGDSPPPSAVPCEGDVCQGPPSVPSLLSAPASATFSGPGNVAPKAKSKTASEIRAEKLAAALKACRAKAKSKRKSCEARARKQYGPKTKAKKSTGRGK